MAVLTERACYLHIPKTGGRFVRAALDAAGISWRESGTVEPWKLSGGRDLFHFAHGDESRKLHSIPRTAEADVVFAFRRHPVDWLRSYHGHDGGRIGGGYLDNRRMRFPDFGDFALSVAAQDPGIVGELFASYGAPEVYLLSSESFVRAITDAGHELAASEVAAILELDPIGVGARSPMGRGVFNAICEAEAEMIERHGFTRDYDQWAQ